MNSFGQARESFRPRLDFRYENLAPPTDEMWEAMRSASARIGMASAEEDGDVRALELLAADLFSTEAALFVPTTTIGTHLALAALDLGENVILAEERSHFYWVERSHSSVIGPAQVLPVAGDRFGALDLDRVEALSKESCYSVGRHVSLLCLENTHNVCGGTCLTPEYMADVRRVADSIGASVYLDGARLMNAAVAQGIPVRELSEASDILVVTLGKGLRAPMGALLCGPKALLESARILGRRAGSMNLHKAGIFAAAAQVALTHGPAWLGEDHRRAKLLAERLADVEGLEIDRETVQTNLVRIGIRSRRLTAEALAERLAGRGVGVHVLDPYAVKMATYQGITDEMVEEAAEIVRAEAEAMVAVAPSKFTSQESGTMSEVQA